MLTERQEQLLTTIVSSYIQSAEPISSGWLEKKGFFDVSSATLRNEMMELENKGYLVQPHVSSGRIPTDKAYRLFVDKLVKTHNLDPVDPLKRKITSTIERAGSDPREVNKIIANLLSELCDNLVITNIRERDDFYKTGLSALFEFPEFREINRIFQMTSFFDHFESMFDQIEMEFFDNDGLRVFIGRENPVADVQDETMITATYQLPGSNTGTLTMIGPTRMNYEKNLTLVKYITEELNRIF